MSVAITKDGPFFTSGPIPLSQLRDNFTGRTSGPVRFSELLRNTNSLDLDPIVPDATENLNISTSRNIKLEQFRGSIKNYYITQTGTDLNLDAAGSTYWNGNLNRNIKKIIYINGTCGSNDASKAAITLDSTAYNVEMNISGEVYGASGPRSTGTGGNAIYTNSPSGNNIVVRVKSGAKIYAGGGGGGRGPNGYTGNSGHCYNETTTSGCGGAPGCPGGYGDAGSWGGGCCQSTCRWCWGCCQQCVRNMQYRRCVQSYSTPGGAGGAGGQGGLGRGYDNFSGSLEGLDGSAGGGGGGCGAGNGTSGGKGAPGGEWATRGQDSSGSGGNPGKAISGTNYQTVGSINSSTIKGAY